VLQFDFQRASERLLARFVQHAGRGAIGSRSIVVLGLLAPAFEILLVDPFVEMDKVGSLSEAL
jgi:hypothetical protein